MTGFINAPLRFAALMSAAISVEAEPTIDLVNKMKYYYKELHTADVRTFARTRIQSALGPRTHSASGSGRVTHSRSGSRQASCPETIIEKKKHNLSILKTDPWWQRRSGKRILAVLQVQDPHNPRKYKYVRGMNSEISMPGGSFCAERAAIASALSSIIGLKPEHIVGVAVLDATNQADKTAANPLPPCGVCSEWISKICAERKKRGQKDDFTLVMFPDCTFAKCIKKSWAVYEVEKRQSLMAGEVADAQEM